MTSDMTESDGLAALAGKYLTFVLGHECYGVPVLKVREIIRLCDITPVPQMPDYIKGVLNLRGNILRQVPGVLKVDGPHNNFHFIGGLSVDDVTLRLTPIKYGFAYSVLQKIHVLRGEEPFTYVRLLPISSEHIRLEILLHGSIRFKSGNANIRKIIWKYDTAIL